MRRRRVLFAFGLLLCLLIAGVASFYASSAPDGLERVAKDQGIATSATSQTDDSPLTGYGIRGVDNARLSGGLAGVAGVGLTLAIAGGLFYFLARHKGPQPAAQPATRPDAQPGQPSAPDA